MVGVPDHVNSSIEFNGDTDSYSVWLTAGSQYDFDVIGHPNNDTDGISPGMFDPTLTLTNPGDYQLFYDDGGGPGFNSHIDFTAQYTGWHILTVAGWGSEQGDYTLYTDYNVLEHVV
jgi:hypothetical protein